MENIILVGHGSPRTDANNIDRVGELLHSALHPGCSDGCVKIAYLQFAKPDILTAIDECAASGAKRIIIHPYFLSSGMHVTKDIPEVIGEGKTRHPEIDFIYTEPLGVHDKLIQIMMERIRSAKFKVPLDIERRSFEIIAEETDLTGIPDEQVPIIQRVIHSTADFEFKSTLTFHPGAIEAGIRALRKGKDILTDVEMVKTGINKTLLSRFGGKVICNIGQQEKPAGEAHAKHAGMKTRAETGIETALSGNHNIGIVAVGNAPTALFKAIELVGAKDGSKDSPLVIGVPVGFVKALESKVLLSKQRFPFITNLSRKGGTPVAVAIVNALLKLADEGQ